jgi:hypothetical protein
MYFSDHFKQTMLTVQLLYVSLALMNCVFYDVLWRLLNNGENEVNITRKQPIHLNANYAYKIHNFMELARNSNSQSKHSLVEDQSALIRTSCCII